ncbi:peptidase inhibitor family I36 protein [Streptomyces sp. NBC_00335]|uniref:peptidase inhibitor family I36 protein n=1 Tax=unclassified Streptomyces TaxID=2593676 RepID=UPI0022562B82|nr:MULTISPECIES: peptidase inhibitor family I36 protein [unclassified Streptomyces]MCX5403848.1 peptidase inhibitor family I36 protein [Streptomyces sp. NBC_00086]
MIRRALKPLITVAAVLGLTSFVIPALASATPAVVTAADAGTMPHAVEDLPDGPPAPDWPTCETGRMCVYSDSDGNGTAQTYGPDSPQVSLAEWNDQISSVHNNSPYWACVYEDPSYGGTVQALPPDSKSNLATSPGTLNGKVSSHKLAKSQAGCFTGFERCQSGNLCLFAEPGGRGQMTATRSDMAQYNATWNDRVASVANHTGSHTCFYADPNHSGVFTGTAYGKFVVLKGDSTVIPDPFDAHLSSHKLVTGTDQC